MVTQSIKNIYSFDYVLNIKAFFFVTWLKKEKNVKGF